MFIEELRAKVLSIAMQGKIVPQEPNDEPICLEKINVEKERLLSERKVIVKNISEREDIRELLYEIPQNWRWFRLSDVVFFQEGPGIRNWQFRDYGIKLLNVKNIVEGQLMLDNSDKFISEEEFEAKYRHFMIKENDILFASSGASWGKLAWYKDPGYKVILNTSTIRLRFYSDHFEKSYLEFYLKSDLFRLQMELQLVGMQPNFGSTHLNRVYIPLPPINEQKCVVNKINELFSIIEVLNTEKTELLELVSKTRSKILQEAIQGKLVLQDPSDEPTCILLEKIKAEKGKFFDENKIKQEKPLPQITDEERPFDIPDSWEFVRLGEVVQINPRNKVDDELDVSFIPMTLISGEYTNVHTSDHRKWKEVKSGFTHFQENDVAIAKITPCFENRKSVVFNNLCNRHGAGTTELHILRSYSNTIVQDYLLWLVKTQHFINSGIATYTGTAGQQRVGKEFISNYIFALPPLAEQHRIVARVNILMALCDQIESTIDISKNNIEILMQLV